MWSLYLTVNGMGYNAISIWNIFNAANHLRSRSFLLWTSLRWVWSMRGLVLSRLVKDILAHVFQLSEPCMILDDLRALGRTRLMGRTALPTTSSSVKRETKPEQTNIITSLCFHNSPEHCLKSSFTHCSDFLPFMEHKILILVDYLGCSVLYIKKSFLKWWH